MGGWRGGRLVGPVWAEVARSLILQPSAALRLGLQGFSSPAPWKSASE